jgi:hypothetical protein
VGSRPAPIGTPPSDDSQSRINAIARNPAGSRFDANAHAATLLGSCMGLAIQLTLENGIGQTTLEFKISLMRPITPETGPIKAEGIVLSRGRRVGTAEVGSQMASDGCSPMARLRASFFRASGQRPVLGAAEGQPSPVRHAPHKTNWGASSS